VVAAAAVTLARLAAKVEELLGVAGLDVEAKATEVGAATEAGAVTEAELGMAATGLNAVLVERGVTAAAQVAREKFAHSS